MEGKVGEQNVSKWVAGQDSGQTDSFHLLVANPHGQFTTKAAQGGVLFSVPLLP